MLLVPLAHLLRERRTPADRRHIYLLETTNKHTRWLTGGANHARRVPLIGGAHVARNREALAGKAIQQARFVAITVHVVGIDVRHVRACTHISRRRHTTHMRMRPPITAPPAHGRRQAALHTPSYIKECRLLCTQSNAGLPRRPRAPLLFIMCAPYVQNVQS